MRRALGCAVLLLIASCGSHQKLSQTKMAYSPLDTRTHKTRKATLSDIKIQEAKQFDIPIPLSAKPLAQQYHVEADRMMLGYRDYTRSSQELIAYYEQEMERLGWHALFAISGNESVLQFAKPDRLCIVSIRPGQRYVDWVITAGYASKAIA